eukprot:12317172-Ditylum_brightwellii.AAC.1
MKNPDKNSKKTSTVSQTPYLFGVNMQKRLLEASKLMRYYKMVGCRMTVLNTVYKTVIKFFTNQWVRMKDQKQQMQPKVLKITGKLPIMATALATRPASVHKDNLPHGEEFDSIEEELVAQASHMHPLHRDDNAA